MLYNKRTNDMNKQVKSVVYRFLPNIIMIDDITMFKDNGIYKSMSGVEPKNYQWQEFFEFLHKEKNEIIKKNSEPQRAVDKLLMELGIAKDN